MNNGAFGEHFPYTNFHDLNMDWIIEIIKDFKSKYEHIQELIDQGIESIDSETSAKLEELSARADELEALLNEWYNTHSQDIANQLQQALRDFVNAADDKAAQTIASIPADYTTLAENVTKVQNIVNNSFSQIYNLTGGEIPNLVTVSDFEQGSFTDAGLNDSSADHTHGSRIRSAQYIPVEPGATYVLGFGNNLAVVNSVSFYTAADFVTPRIGATSWSPSTFQFPCSLITIPNDAHFARILLAAAPLTAETPITPEDIENYFVYFQKTSAGLNNTGMLYNYGGETAGDGGINTSSNAITSVFVNTGKIIIPPEKGRGFICLYSNSGYMGKINASGQIDQVSGNWKIFSGEIDIKEILSQYNASFIQLTIQTTDPDDPITQENTNEWGNRNLFFLNNSSLLKYVESLVYADNSNYILNSGAHKTPITVNALSKQISGAQAFCKYDGNWYSTDGTTLYVQDTTFSQTGTYALNLGHGNSMHTGAKYPSRAYVSGWDNDKLYIVDLTTHTIIDTLTLPVSGYTTCAVDDENNICYIFYRSTTPDTEDTYEFITWNYVTNEIIIRKKINKFAAMQACDFYHGKIIVAYGLANTKAGIFVYSTTGDVLAEYKLSTITGNEPEGVMLDRNTQQLYFSLVNRNMYSIK